MESRMSSGWRSSRGRSRKASSAVYRNSSVRKARPWWWVWPDKAETASAGSWRTGIPRACGQGLERGGPVVSASHNQFFDHHVLAGEGFFYRIVTRDPTVPFVPFVSVVAGSCFHDGDGGAEKSRSARRRSPWTIRWQRAARMMAARSATAVSSTLFTTIKSYHGASCTSRRAALRRAAICSADSVPRACSLCSSTSQEGGRIKR